MLATSPRQVLSLLLSPFASCSRRTVAPTAFRYFATVLRNFPHCAIGVLDIVAAVLAVKHFVCLNGPLFLPSRRVVVSLSSLGRFTTARRASSRVALFVLCSWPTLRSEGELQAVPHHAPCFSGVAAFSCGSRGRFPGPFPSAASSEHSAAAYGRLQAPHSCTMCVLFS